MSDLNEEEKLLCNAILKSGALTRDEIKNLVQNFLQKRQEDITVDLVTWLTDYIRQKKGEPAVAKTLQHLNSYVILEDDAPSGLERQIKPWTLAPHERYEDIRMLGEGGMGAVKLVRDKVFNRVVAMKYPLETDADTLRTFLREATYHSRLQHPSIPPVHDMGELRDGRPYYTMKVVEGETLHEIYKGLRRKSPKYQEEYPLDRLVNIIIEICNGMAYAHSQGIIHRDLKPPNIMVGKHGEVQIMDWGLAKRVFEIEEKVKEMKVEKLQHDEGEHLTIQVTIDEGTVKGTLSYMAPEHAQADPDKPSDVYSIGAILQEVLTRRVFRNFPKGLTPVNMLYRIVKDEGKVGYSRPVLLPGPLQSIIAKAIAPRPGQRYTAPQLAEDLQNFLVNKPVKAHKYGNLEKAATAMRRHPRLTAAGAAALVLASIAGPTIGYFMTAAKENKIRAVQAERDKEKQTRIAQENALRAAEAETAKANAEAETAKAEAALSKTLKEQLNKAQRRNRATQFYQQAIDILTRVQKIDVSQATNLEKIIKEDIKNAEKLLSKSISQEEGDPDYPDAHFQLGLLRYEQLKGQEAIEHFTDANKASLRDSKQLHAPALFYAGIVHVDVLDDLANSVENLKQLEKIPDQNNPYSVLAKSLAAFSNGQFDEAIKLAETAHTTSPTMWEALYFLAMYRSEGIGGPFNKSANRKNRNHALADKLLSEALAINPGQVRCLYRRVWLNSVLDKDKAVQIGEHLVKRYPHVPQFRTTLGFIRYARGEIQESLELLIEAERLGDTGATNLATQAMLYKHLENYQKAEEYFTRAIEQKHSPAHYAHRSHVRLLQNKLEGAITDAEEAIRRDPQNSRAYCYRGLYHTEIRQHEKAVADFKKSATLGYSPAHYELGVLYIRIGEKAKAQEALNAYLMTNDTYRKKEALQLMETLKK